MREILFRGFHERENGNTVITVNGEKKRGKWVEGYYTVCVEHGDNGGAECMYRKTATNLHYISDIEDVIFLVIPETVSQSTGLTDKNGKKIFENYIVIFNKNRNLPNSDTFPKTVKWHKGDCAFQSFPFGKSITRGGSGKLLQPDMMAECEVIGNIFDNPELLEREVTE